MVVLRVEIRVKTVTPVHGEEAVPIPVPPPMDKDRDLGPARLVVFSQHRRFRRLVVHSQRRRVRYFAIRNRHRNRNHNRNRKLPGSVQAAVCSSSRARVQLDDLQQTTSSLLGLGPSASVLVLVLVVRLIVHLHIYRHKIQVPRQCLHLDGLRVPQRHLWLLSPLPWGLGHLLVRPRSKILILVQVVFSDNPLVRHLRLV